MQRFDPRRLPRDWSAKDAALLQAIDDATATPIHMDYAIAPEWAEGVNCTIDQLETSSLRPDVAIELVEHMLGRLLSADIDDSDGWTVGFCERLLPVHRAAADAAGLSAVQVAKRARRFRKFDFDPFAELSS